MDNQNKFSNNNHDTHFIRVPKKDYVGDALILKLMEHFEGLEVHESSDTHTVFRVNQLAEDLRKEFILDLKFFLDNPHVPLENVCSRLANYRPNHNSQYELLKFAGGMLSMDRPRLSAGLFIYGKPGIGKTHMAVALTKEFMKKGLRPIYVKAGMKRNKRMEHALDNMNTDQVWIIDDLNSPDGDGMELFKHVLSNVHDHGGRIFVTSNTPYDYIMEKGYVADEHERQKDEDRIRSIFKVIHIDGESYREKDRWYGDLED